MRTLYCLTVCVAATACACTPAPTATRDASANAAPPTAPAPVGPTALSSTTSPDAKAQDATSTDRSASDPHPTALFGAELFAQVDTSGNTLLSPFSVASALSMLRAGAEGNTAQQLDHALHANPSSEQERRAWKETLSGYRSEDKNEPTVEVANRVFGHRDVQALPEYLERTKTEFGAPYETVDFGNQEAARKRINAWVSDRTNQAIIELLGPNQIPPNTKLALVNAMHIKGTWTEPFPSYATTPSEFHAETGDVKVDTMHGVRKTRYAEVRGTKIIALPFRTKGARPIEVVIALPEAGASTLRAKDIGEWTAALDQSKVTTVELSLPKFKLKFRAELSSALQSLGITDAFSVRANFSGISRAPELQLSTVAHEAMIDVFETGAEAAAATSAMVDVKGMEYTSTTMVVNRPCYALVRDRKTGAMLIMAHVRNPNG